MSSPISVKSAVVEEGGRMKLFYYFRTREIELAILTDIAVSTRTPI